MPPFSAEGQGQDHPTPPDGSESRSGAELPEDFVQGAPLVQGLEIEESYDDVKAPEGIWKCIYNLPCCGGFFAPTVNPDTTWARHFSNENTLPPIPWLKIGPVVEWSICCRCCGRLGRTWSDAARRRIMLAAFAMSFVSLILTIYAALALSRNVDVVRAVPWVSGRLFIPALGTNDTEVTLAQVHVGVNMRVDSFNCAGLRSLNSSACIAAAENAGFEPRGTTGLMVRAMHWNDNITCNKTVLFSQHILYDLHILFNFTAQQEANRLFCVNCQKQTLAAVSLLTNGILTHVPQLATDLQRLTRFGDVNCMNTIGMLASLDGFVSTLLALQQFVYHCVHTAPTRIAAGDGSSLRFESSFGWSFIALVVATALKLFDVFCHLIVQTPSARWSSPPEEVQDVRTWMALATEGEQSKPH